MPNFKMLILGLLAVVVNSPAATAQRAPVETFHLVILKTGKDLPEDKAGEIRKGHFAHLDALAIEGLSVAAGPVSGWNGVQGLVIVRASSEEAAREIASRDPAVQGGYLTTEVITFTANVIFGKAHRPIKMESVVFGLRHLNPAGLRDAVDVNTLITSVVVSPYAPEARRADVQQTLLATGLSSPVLRSLLTGGSVVLPSADDLKNYG